MNNFCAMECVRGVRKPPEKAFGRRPRRRSEKVIPYPVVTEASRWNPIALQTYWNGDSYYPNPFANIRSEKGECKFFAHYFLLPICQEVLNYCHHNDKNRTT